MFRRSVILGLLSALALAACADDLWRQFLPDVIVGNEPEDAGPLWKIARPDPAVTAWRGVYALTPDLVWAVGDDGAIVRFDGTAWTKVESGTTEHLESVWAFAPDDIWAVGWNGTVLHSTGAAFAPVPSPTTKHLFSVYGSRNHVFIVGEGGTILTPDDAGVREMIAESTVSTFPVCETRIDDATEAAANCTPTEIPGQPGVRYPTCGTPGECCVNPGGSCCYYQRCDADGGAMAGRVGVDGDLKAVWVSGDFAIACGSGGSIYEFRDGDRGRAWYEMQLADDVPFTRDSLVAAWGTSPGFTTCAGQDGRWMVRSGDSWRSRTIPTPVYVQGLWGTSHRDVYAVGFSGVLLRLDGFGLTRDAGWYPEPVEVETHLRGISGARLDYDGGPGQTPEAGPPPARVFAVGAQGLILQKN